MKNTNLANILVVALIVITAVVLIYFGIQIFKPSPVPVPPIAEGIQKAEPIAEKAALKTYLSDLEPLSSIGSYLKDISPEKHLISVQGSKFEKGLCVSSPSELTYNLDGEYAYFKCIIGHHDDYPEYKGLLVFRVLVDGKKVYESRPMRASDSEEVNVTVKDANHLTLTVKDDGIGSSYVVWADARVF